MTLIQFERSGENTRKFCHCEDDEFCQLGAKALINQSNWKLLTETKVYSQFTMIETLDFTEMSLKRALKAGEPGYF
jgi:hypothetical protein